MESCRAVTARARWWLETHQPQCSLTISLRDSFQTIHWTPERIDVPNAVLLIEDQVGRVLIQVLLESAIVALGLREPSRGVTIVEFTVLGVRLILVLHLYLVSMADDLRWLLIVGLDYLLVWMLWVCVIITRFCLWSEIDLFYESAKAVDHHWVSLLEVWLGLKTLFLSHNLIV